MHRCLARLYYILKKTRFNKKGGFPMMSLNCKDLGMDHSFELTGRNEQEIMRKFISHAETSLQMPVLTAETIYRVKMSIRK
jgi:predicted small metal-binding protein